MVPPGVIKVVARMMVADHRQIEIRIMIRNEGFYAWNDQKRSTACSKSDCQKDRTKIITPAFAARGSECGSSRDQFEKIGKT